jgi:hypothetical protein
MTTCHGLSLAVPSTPARKDTTMKKEEQPKEDSGKKETPRLRTGVRAGLGPDNVQ